MSIKEVIDRAAELGGWKLNSFDAIRRYDSKGRNPQCPISSLAGATCGQFVEVGKAHGLSLHQRDLIAGAADNDRGSNKHIRRYMLKKFNLQEAR